MSYSEAMAKHYQDKTNNSIIKVGDVVEFKNYEDMTDDENLSIPKDRFPKSGKVREVMEQVDEVLFFFIERSTCVFSSKSVARVISDVDDVDSFSPGEEVWVKATVNVCYDDVIFINPVERFVDKDNVLHRTPEHSIVK